MGKNVVLTSVAPITLWGQPVLAGTLAVKSGDSVQAFVRKTPKTVKAVRCDLTAADKRAISKLMK